MGFARRGEAAVLEFDELGDPEFASGEGLDAVAEVVDGVGDIGGSDLECGEFEVWLDDAGGVAVVEEPLPEELGDRGEAAEPGVLPFGCFGEAFHLGRGCEPLRALRARRLGCVGLVAVVVGG